MKLKALKLLFLSVCLVTASGVFAYTSPGKPSGFVNDFASILSIENRAALEAKLSALEKTTKAEVSVVSVKSLGDETIETYAVKLFEEWQIGKAKEDNGLLILIAPNEREMRIETGYGLEPVVTDAAAFGIIRKILTPAFQNNDYAGGINGAVDAVSSLIKGELGASEFEDNASEGSTGMIDWLPIAVIFLFQLVPVVIYSKSWWLGGLIGLGLGFLFTQSLLFGGIFAVIGLIIDFILSKIFGGKMPPGGSGGVWFGGMGGGRSSGGFGGFGGGSSGGGGASGRW